MNGAGGAETSLGSLAPRLVDRGIDVAVAISEDRRAQIDELLAVGIVVHDHSKVRNPLSRLVRLFRVVRETRPDVIHAMLWDSTLFGQIIGWITGTPVVVTWASVGNEADHLGSRTWKHKVIRTAETVLARMNQTEFHAVTQGVADFNAIELRIAADRVHVVERGRPEIALIERADLDDLRRRVGVSAAATVVLAVGRGVPIKGHMTLIAAFDEVSRNGHNAVLLIAGEDGVATPAIRSEIARRGLGENVYMLGHRDDVDRLLQVADIFVSSSISEGAAGSIIEALSIGLPVVSTDVQGMRGILVHNQNCLLSPIGDSSAMAAAIIRLLDEETLAARIGESGRATYEQRFTLDQSVDATLDLYQQVLKKRRR